MLQVYCHSEQKEWNPDIRCGYAHPHTAAHTQALMEHFNWELFDHPDLTPNDYHLFSNLKNWLGSQHFNNNEELMEGVKTWLRSRAADLFDIVNTYKNLFPNTSASIPVATTFRSSLCMYVFFVYNEFFFLTVLLTAHRRLLSE
jgi:hypothetical protein